MGYGARGRLIWDLGVWGCADPLPNFTYSPHCSSLHTWIRLQLVADQSANPLREITMYTVHILWGNHAVTHTAWSLASAKEWLYKYPKDTSEGFFGKVTDLFGRRVAVRHW